MCIIDCLSTIVFILPLHLDYTKVIILILWWRNFQLEYWRTFQLVSTLKDAIALLGLVTKANPLGLLLGALSGIVALFYAFREEAKTTTEVITDLNKTIADTNDKMQGNKAVDSLIDRYETLSKKANKSTEESQRIRANYKKSRQYIQRCSYSNG